MLSLITFLPLIGGLVILALPKERKDWCAVWRCCPLRRLLWFR
jgi:NADH:ubiquinone oxidoreductase subunit 4 (subunit M)